MGLFLKKRRFKSFKDDELRVLKAKLSGSNTYDEPVSSRLWREINHELEFWRG